MSEQDTSSSAEPTEHGAFCWEAHPARERPLAAVTAILVILAFSLAVYLFSESAIWAVVAAVVLCLAQSRFFFATRYTIDADLIRARYLFSARELRWDEVRRVDVGALAAWISPYKRRSWRESRRGVHVLFGKRREEVLRRVEAAAKLVR